MTNTQTTTNTWRKVYGPSDTFQQCGDDALFEVGSVYALDGDESTTECEVVYYVVGYKDHEDDAEFARYGIEEMNHSYTVNADGTDTDDDEYTYDSAWSYFIDTFEAAKAKATELASADESWMFS